MYEKLPTFFIPGASKCGTTSLYYYLKQHPQIFMPTVKEPHFFDFDHFYSKGIKYYITTYFNRSDGYIARGEATPNYFCNPEKVIPRILNVYNKSLPKFIILLRDPVYRAWSHYLHRVREMREKEIFEKALLLEEDRSKKGDYWIGYFSEGLYTNFIKQWLSIFPRENFLFLLTDDLKGDVVVKTLSSIYQFLGVDDGVKINITPKNTYGVTRCKTIAKWLMEPPLILKVMVKLSTTKNIRSKIKELVRFLNYKPDLLVPNIPYNIEEKLNLQYRDSIKELEKIIDRDLSQWIG